MDKTNEQLQNELENLRKIVFRIMDFNFPDLDANIKHYDFVTDETVRRQLELDYLKMMQTPASNFNEYCHYSFFQIENLINYYYTIRFQSKEELQQYFKFKNYPKEVVKTRVSEIPYSFKWAKFANEFLMTEKKCTDKMTGEEKMKKVAIPLNYDIQKIAYVRNSSIHRNTIDIEKYEYELFQKYIAIKSKPNKSEDEWNIYNEGNKVEFKLSESFSLVKKRTAEFLKIIQPEIVKYQSDEKITM